MFFFLPQPFHRQLKIALWRFVRFLDKRVKDHYLPFNHSAIEHPGYALLSLWPKLKQPGAHRPGMRHLQK
jgi:hypothetical protein